MKEFFDHHNPFIENKDIILYETLLEKGQELPMHVHDYPHVRYSFSHGFQEHTWTDGHEILWDSSKGKEKYFHKGEIRKILPNL